MPQRVFKLLMDSAGRAVTGPEFSRALGITRAAVWKKIQLLRAEGFMIEASREGYGLLPGGPDLSARQLGYHLPAVKIVFKENMPSTNDMALLLAMEKGFFRGAGPLSALVVADCQSAGRGRLGRSWMSPPGANIYMSAAMRPDLPPRKAPLLALAAGLAAALAIKGQTGLDVRLKWPNDIVVPGKENKKKGAEAAAKKLGGILVELRSDPDRVLCAAAGIGINVNMKKAGIPGQLRPIATSILAETGETADRPALIAAVYRELGYWAGLLHSGAGTGGQQRLLKAYRNLCDTVGRQVCVQSEGRHSAGMATGIDDDGRLILRTTGGTLRFSTGDVMSVRTEKKEMKAEGRPEH